MDEDLQQLVAAFEGGNVDRAMAVCRKLGGEVRKGRNPGLEAIIDDLRDRVADQPRAAGFAAVIDELVGLVRVRQGELQRKVLPLIRSRGRRYRKAREVHAKKASGGEVVVSMTGDGRETENTAAAGDYVVRNTTRAGEEYIVEAARFESRYRYAGDLGDGWRRYSPTSEIRALEVDTPLLAALDKPEMFYIEAPWGEAQRVRKGDRLATSAEGEEIYRIAAPEFRETYELISEG